MVGPAVAGLAVARSKLLWAAGRNAKGQFISRAGLAGLGAVSAALDNAVEEQNNSNDPVFVNVSSSAISQIGFQNGTITVVFNRGGSYDYPGTRETFDEFINAPSIGQYFNANIKP